MKTEKFNRKEMLKLLLCGYGIVAVFAVLRVLTDLQAWFRRIKGAREADL